MDEILKELERLHPEWDEVFAIEEPEEKQVRILGASFEQSECIGSKLLGVIWQE